MSVLVNDFRQCSLVHLEHFLVNAVLLQFFREKEFPGDFHLLLGKVTCDIDQLHPVQKGRLDSGNVIRRGDEQHVRQVIVHIQIVIVERHILLRVKYFEQCRRRVALEVAAELVDLIQNHDRI